MKSSNLCLGCSAEEALVGLCSLVNLACGQSWTPTSAPITNWIAIASSEDGNKWVAAVNGGEVLRIILAIGRPVPYHGCCHPYSPVQAFKEGLLSKPDFAPTINRRLNYVN